MNCFLAFGIGYFLGAAMAFVFLLFALQDRRDKR